MNRSKLATAFLAIVIGAAPTRTLAIDFGINSPHPGALNADVAALMKERNFRSARTDLLWDRDVTGLRDQASRIQANGGTVQVSLQVAYQWDESCRQDLGTLEQEAYAQAVTAIDKVKDLVHDFELLNETQLRPEIQREVPWNSAGARAGAYQDKACVAALAAALRGMSNAVSAVRASSGLPLRSILGVVGRDFGFLAFMRQQGVAWDVTGFHVYPTATQPSLLSDPWYGTGGLFTQLASFGKPVHINEINCGEIYKPDYGSVSSVETCLRGLARHLKDITEQHVADIEYVHFYALIDELQRAPPENRFGLMKNIGQPKVQLFLATALAGGKLSTDERKQLSRRGLLTEAGPVAFERDRLFPRRVKLTGRNQVPARN